MADRTVPRGYAGLLVTLVALAGMLVSCTIPARSDVRESGPAPPLASAPASKGAPRIAGTTNPVPGAKGPLARGSPDNEPDSGDEQEHKVQIDALFKPFSDGDGPGGAVIVIHDGQVVYKAGYGLANLQTRLAITPTSIFHLGSVGKQFTALAIMLLKEQGRLDFDDPVGKHLPELKRFGTEVTIRHLLHHTSGIADYDEDDALHDAIERHARYPSNTDLIDVLETTGRPRFKPGDKFKYSNTGFDVLGAVIERLSEQTYADFLQERVFSRTGMTSTFALPSSRFKSPEVCISYDVKGDRRSPVRSHPFDNLNGSGSVCSNVEDLYRYDQALFNGKLVRERTLAEALTPGRLNDGSSTEYGFGWEIEHHKGKATVGHGGSWLAFDNHYLRFPAQKLTVIVLLNQEHADPQAGKLAADIADLFLDD